MWKIFKRRYRWLLYFLLHFSWVLLGGLVFHLVEQSFVPSYKSVKSDEMLTEMSQHYNESMTFQVCRLLTRTNVSEVFENGSNWNVRSYNPLNKLVTLEYAGNPREIVEAMWKYTGAVYFTLTIVS